MQCAARRTAVAEMASRSRSQARLKLVKQNCIHQETLLRDGVNKDVFVVVKNSPFQVQLGVENEGTVHDPTMNLSQVTMKAELLYDAPGEKVRSVDAPRVTH